MYAKCGDPVVFNRMMLKNISTWNDLISCTCNLGIVSWNSTISGVVPVLVKTTAIVVVPAKPTQRFSRIVGSGRFCTMRSSAAPTILNSKLSAYRAKTLKVVHEKT
ncbi:hypothetical protein SDJN02_10823, partial [Cucurbita argyrosperma subsp. argyrosperma]